MLVAQAEAYTTCLPELRLLYPSHWEELAVDHDIPLAPRYDIYEAMDKAGLVLLTTLRDDGALAGYFIGFLMPEMHYGGCLACTGDIFYVRPYLRKLDPWAGVKLFRFTETVLRDRGVQRWYAVSKLLRDSGAMLRRLGFTAIETNYSKRLK